MSTVTLWGRIAGSLVFVALCLWAAWEYTRNMDKDDPKDDGRWWT